jgi:type I restriction enzyme S subunit
MKMNKVKLGDIANYSDTRIKCSDLSFENFVGTDNILQNKQGKENSQYTPNSGFITGYKKNDILIANIRPYLKKIWYATNDGGSSADVLTIRVNNEKFLPKFVYYNLFQDSFFDYAMKGSKGSKMPRGDKEQIFNFPICNFDLPTQSAIAHVLSFLDDKIELNNKINKELENLAKTIYEYWFVQNADKRWVKKKLNELGEFKNGANYEKANKVGENVKIVNVRDISASSIFIDVENLDEIILQKNEIGKYLLDENDIIFARSGIPGAIRLIEKTEGNIIFCGFSIRFRLNDRKLKEYLFFVLKQNEEFAKNKSGGSIMPNISQDSLKDILITIPPSPILQKFNKTVSPIFSAIIKNRQENNYLAQLRDFLLPLLMNGQVKVDIKK